MSWVLVIGAVFSLALLWTLYTYITTHAVCQLPYRLDGQLVLVTGCNQGIGLELVGELARRGARVVMACRDLERAKTGRQQLLRRFGTGVDVEPSQPYQSPITEEQSIRSFADRMRQKNEPIKILVNNGGIDLYKPEYDSSGIELQLKVNHLGHFLLSQWLRPLLDAAGGARIVVTSSLRHRFATLNLEDLSHPIVGACYSSSKLANVIHANELSKRWGPNIVAVSLHPGLVRTEVFRHHPIRHWIVHHMRFSKTAWQGAQTLLHCCLAKDLVPGGYYAECRLATVNSQALQDGVGEKLWMASEQLVERWSQQPEEQ
ncbi:retinol dehydrogenase 12 [Clonorchis sinensis]|uniref:Retinol dehydrogenase 12 n=1 Tax=Clonorchis sinensis TaxID=79923 RepID=H2KT06_CLOSI|nr:retinol dehydrogenase 12 [Clonorchis sinensis]